MISTGPSSTIVMYVLVAHTSAMDITYSTTQNLLTAITNSIQQQNVQICNEVDANALMVGIEYFVPKHLYNGILSCAHYKNLYLH